MNKKVAEALSKMWGRSKATAVAAAQKQLNAAAAAKLQGTDWATDFAAKAEKEPYRVFVMEFCNDTWNGRPRITFRICLRKGWLGVGLGAADLIKMEFVGTEVEGSKKCDEVRAKAREMARQWRKEWYGPDEWAEFARDRILEPEKFKDLIEE